MNIETIAASIYATMPIAPTLELWRDSISLGNVFDVVFVAVLGWTFGLYFMVKMLDIYEDWRERKN